MAALTPSDAVLRVLENVGRVSGDQQLPAEAITRRLDDEYRRLRRRLSDEFPSLYEARSGNLTIAAGASSFAKPTGCEKVLVVQKQVGSSWIALPVAPSVNRDEMACLAFYEQGANIVIAPELSAPGTYRCYYIQAPASSVTTYDVPDGLEGIIVEEASAWARQRHDEDPSYHKAVAKQIWDEQYMALWDRYGATGQPGLQIVRGY